MTSRTFSSSAPGKVVLLGEYAVVGGAPALVAAVDRRARVRLTTSEQPGWRIDSPELGIVGARATLADDGRVCWDGPAAADRLGLVGAVLESVIGTDFTGTDVTGTDFTGTDFAGTDFAGTAVTGTDFTATAPAPPSHITLDTGELYAPAVAPGKPRIKLGLGSSAALTVALAGALAAAAGRPEPGVADLLATHRLMQGGRGSGIDIAAALTGGLLRFERVGSELQIECLTLPTALTWCAVWTGCPASTGTFLARIADWRAAEPDRHDRLLARLARTSSDGIGAVVRQDAAAVLGAVDAYAGLLQQLGEASGADIVSAEHRRLSTLAEQSGVSYKSCGAGGGDVGVAITTDPDRLDLFRERASQDGFSPLDLAVDPLGLTVDRDRS